MAPSLGRTLLVATGALTALSLAVTWGSDPPSAPSASSETPSSSTDKKPPTYAAATPQVADAQREAAVQSPEVDAEGAYFTDRVMVATRTGVDPERVAADHGTTLTRAPGPSGVVSMQVPAGMDVGAFVEVLSSDDAVDYAGQVGVMQGAGKGGGKGNAPSTDGATTDGPATPDGDTSDGGTTDGGTTDGDTSDGGTTDGGTTDGDTSDGGTTDGGTTDGGTTSDGIKDGAGPNTDPCMLNDVKGKPRAQSLQWHLEWLGAPTPDEISLSDITIAVLDTGVAYETRTQDGRPYVQAPSLADVPIVAPWDFVNGDAHANDDHQHGTHIATTIAARGAVEGVAPGATLMPLKVLNENNQGSEVDLVDAIHHAIENGADVLNMSLSFHAKYVPSVALRAALDAAAEAGVVMVGASGNNGLYTTTWPAAHPEVLAVSSTNYTPDRAPDPPAFANRSAKVAIMAPGGNLHEDANGDGQVDGIVAETIGHQQPDEVGLWMMAGTSQATAMVSAAAAYPLAKGASPEVVRQVLAASALSNDWVTHYDRGMGAGVVHLGNAIWETCAGNVTATDADRVGAAVLPVLVEETPGQITPRTLVALTDPSGRALARMKVHATLSGATGGHLMCETDRTGTCTMDGPPTSAIDLWGEPRGLAWSVTIDAVEDAQHQTPYRPRAVLWASDALEVLTAAAQDAGLEDALLALTWDGTPDPELGALSPGVTILSAGTGLATSPMGVVANPAMFADTGTTTSANLDLDGTGLATSPMGLYPVTLLSLDGTGLATSPMGFTTLNLLGLNGTGLATSPMGFSWTSMVLGSSTWDEPALDLNGARIDLQSATVDGQTGQTSVVAEVVETGGWVDPVHGQDGASILLGSGVLVVEAERVDGQTQAGVGAMPVTP